MSSKSLIHINSSQEAILNALPEMICVLDNRGNIVFENQQLIQCLGYAQEERLGKSIIDYMPSDEQYKLVDLDAEDLLEPKACLCSQKTKNGDWLLLEAKVKSFDLAEDVPTYLVSFRRANKEKYQQQSVGFQNKQMADFFRKTMLPQFIVDRKTFKMVDVNEAALQFYGYTKSQMLNKTLFDINTLEPDEIKDKMERALQSDSIIYEFKHRISNGEIKEVLVYGTNYIEGDKHFMFVNVVDNSIISKSKKKLEKQRNEYKYLNEMLTGMFSITERKLLFQYVASKINHFVPKSIVLLISVDENKNRTQLEAVSGLKENLFTQVTKMLGFRPMEKLYPLEQGHYSHFKRNKLVPYTNGLYDFAARQIPEMVCSTIEKLVGIASIKTMGINSNDKLLGAIHILLRKEDADLDHNIIEIFIRQLGVFLERFVYLEQIRKSEERLRQTNAEKDKFFSVVSHDLRSPYNAILGFSQLALEDMRNGEYKNLKQYFITVNKAMKQNFDLLNNLLQWSRLQMGRMDIKMVELEAEPLLKSIIKSLELNILNKSIYFSYSFSHEKMRVFADRYMLETAIRNLLSNAIKFTNINGHIRIDVIRKKDHDLIVVNDNGVGMSNEQMEGLFDISQNSSTKGTQNEVGTGLGLVLVKEFVEKMGGVLHVNSQLNKGTTIQIQLKRKRN